MASYPSDNSSGNGDTSKKRVAFAPKELPMKTFYSPKEEEGAAKSSRHVVLTSASLRGARDKASEAMDASFAGSGGSGGAGLSASAGWTRSQMARVCNRKQLLKRVPVLEWLPKYSVHKGVADLIAGVTVALTVIPQGIAYASVAGLSAEYGLYSGFMGCFMYCLFGSSKDITVGPTAIMALMTAEHVSQGGAGADFAILLSFISGIIIFLFGILKLGFLIDFISVPVIAGFTSAAAVTIASSQVKELLGLYIPSDQKSHIEGIVGTWVDVFSHIESTRWQDATLGISCCVVLLLMRKLNGVTWFKSLDTVEHATCCQTFWSRFSPTLRAVAAKGLWIVCTARNAVIVIVCVLIAYLVDPDYDSEFPRNSTFILTGDVAAGLPPFKPPPFNTTYNGEQLDFVGMLQTLGSAVIVIPLIAILENVAIAKAFAGGKPVDASQEMIALGICNVMGSFVGSMPTTGSFSRTAVNSASGVQTPFGGVYTGAVVLLALAVLMPLCAYIPKATLAAVIITAVIFSVEYEVIRPMWRSKKIDLFCGLCTFISCAFWALEFGILVGVGIQIVVLLYNMSRPVIQMQIDQFYGPGTEYLTIRLDRAVIFPSVNFVRSMINKAGLQHAESRTPVIIDCMHLFTTDFTAAEGFADMVKDFERRHQPVFFINVRKSVHDTLVGPAEGHSNLAIVNSTSELLEILQEVFANEMESGEGAMGLATAVAPLLSPAKPTAEERRPSIVVE